MSTTSTLRAPSRMVTAALLPALLLVLLPALADEASGPRVEILDPVVDLGPLVRGAVAEATFRLRNAGDEPLRVLRVKPG